MHSQSHQKELILASTSRYRQSLLSRLCIPFIPHPPEVDETALPDETAQGLTQRLALAKATDISGRFPDAVVIGSDQAADFNGRIVGKPATVEHAVEQLLGFSGQEVIFYTSVAVVCASNGFAQTFTDTTRVAFRDLEPDEAERYVEMDQPLDCAGGFKSESAGPALMRTIQSTDPTGLIGLPLIGLSRILREAGFKLP